MVLMWSDVGYGIWNLKIAMSMRFLKELLRFLISFVSYVMLNTSMCYLIDGTFLKVSICISSHLNDLLRLIILVHDVVTTKHLNSSIVKLFFLIRIVVQFWNQNCRNMCHIYPLHFYDCFSYIWCLFQYIEKAMEKDR